MLEFMVLFIDDLMGLSMDYLVVDQGVSKTTVIPG